MVRTRLFCVILLLATDAIAQYTSGIEGTVVDQSGSAISSARVVITNEATQVTRELTTNASGYFRAPDLAPGPYHVQVQLPGFQNWALTNIHVHANQLTTRYPTLLVGEQTPQA